MTNQPTAMAVKPTQVHLEPDERHVVAHISGRPLLPWLHQCFVDPTVGRSVIVFTPDGAHPQFTVDHHPSRPDQWGALPRPTDATALTAGLVYVAEGTLTGADNTTGVPVDGDPDNPLPWLLAAAEHLIPWVDTNVLGAPSQS